MSGLFNGVPFGVVVGQVWSPTGELVPLQYGKIDVAASGDTTLLAGVAGKRIYLMGLEFLCSNSVTVGFKSGSAPILINPQSFGANSGKVLPPAGLGYTKTEVGEALVITLGGAVQVSGSYVVAVL